MLEINSAYEEPNLIQSLRRIKMAGIKPGFITGANAKIKAGLETLAFCTDVSYNVEVQTIPIESMGKYEVHTHEPVGYAISGNLSIIRYTSRANTNGISDATASKGNSPAEIVPVANGANWEAMMDPAKMLTSQTFDLELSEKTGATTDTTFFKISDCRFNRRGSSLNKRGVLVDQYSFVAVLGSDTGTVGHSKMAAAAAPAAPAG